MTQAEQAITVMEEAAQRERAAVPVTSPSEDAAILSLIERAARDPSVNVETMERMFKMRNEAKDRHAREMYDAAFAEMQVELPTIDQKGRIVVRHKDDKDLPIDKQRVVQSTAFAKFEDINDAIKPTLAAHGFGLSFRTGLAPDGKVTVIGILSHRGGHREETMMALPHDSTGSKNAVQAIGSSTSYGRRYVTLALLNITSRLQEDRDDDGQAAAGPALVTDDQVKQLSDALKFRDRDEAKFCKLVMKVASLADIPADKFADALRVIETAPRPQR